MQLYSSFTNANDREVFLAVYSFMNNGVGDCRASHRTIAKRARLSRATVNRTIPKLIQNNYLEVAHTVPVRGGFVNVYVLSGTQRATNSAEVAHTEREVAHTDTHKQLKETKYTHVRDINNEVISSIAMQYELDEADVADKWEDLKLWLVQNGKKKKNYKAFLQACIRRDLREGKMQRLGKDEAEYERLMGRSV